MHHHYGHHSVLIITLYDITHDVITNSPSTYQRNPNHSKSRLKMDSCQVYRCFVCHGAVALSVVNS
jgi:hypothetical protein